MCCRRLVKHGVASEKPLDSVVITRMKKFAAMNRLKKVRLPLRVGGWGILWLWVGG